MGDSRGIGSRIFTGGGFPGDNWRQPARVRDGASALKPLGAVNIDGITPIVNGDRVLFTTLAGLELADNNKVFRAVEAAGLVTAWNLDTDGQPSGLPQDGNIIYIKEGTTYGDKIYKWTGSGWSEIGAGGGAGANQQLSNLLSPVTPPFAFRQVDGSVGAPSYTFASSISTGLYAPAVGQVAVAAAGINVVTFGGTIPVAVKTGIHGTVSSFGSGAYVSTYFGDAIMSAGATLSAGGVWTTTATATAAAIYYLNVNGVIRFFTDQGLPSSTVFSPTERMSISSAIITTVPVRATAGSAAVPGYSFSGDTNTGFYSVGADILGISIGGAAKIDIGAFSIAPFANYGMDLGTSSKKFASIYLHNVYTYTVGGADSTWLQGTATNTPSGVSVDGALRRATNSTGALAIYTPDKSGLASQDILIETGNVTLGAFVSGSINLRVGDSTGTRGEFRFLKAGAAPVVGHVWTCSNVDGSGYYAAAGGGGGQTWTKYTKVYADFSIGALTNSISLFSLPLKGVIHAIVIKHSTAFSGTGILSYTISAGISGNTTKYASAFDVFQATGAGVGQTTNVVDFESDVGATTIEVTATSTGANLNAAAGVGTVDIWVLTSTLP